MEAGISALLIDLSVEAEIPSPDASSSMKGQSRIVSSVIAN